MEVKALLLSPDLTLSVGMRNLPLPPPGEVLVSVEWAGVCGSDLHVMATGDWVSYWPATLGHEVAGVVSLSDDVRWPAGTRVILDSRMPRYEGECWVEADRLDPKLSWLGEARSGGFAEATVVPVESLHRIPDGLSTDVAVLAEPLAVVLSAVERLPQTAPISILLMGYGPIGFLTHSEVHRRWPSASIWVAEPNTDRASMAAQRGATVVSQPSEGGYDLIIDAAGHPASMRFAIDNVKRGGSVLLVALPHASFELDPAVIVEKSIAIFGTNGFDTPHLEEALSILQTHPSAFDGLVSHRVPLTNLDSVIKSKERVQAMKILVDCR